MQRVDEKQLLDEGNGIYSYEGHPFSGVAFELFSDGSLRSEITLVDGHQEGVARDWYENGQLKFEGIFLGATLHGPSKQWFPNGRVRSESLSEFGISLSNKEWNEDGELIKDFVLAESHFNYEILLRYRAIYGNRDKRASGKAGFDDKAEIIKGIIGSGRARELYELMLGTSPYFGKKNAVTRLPVMTEEQKMLRLLATHHLEYLARCEVDKARGAVTPIPETPHEREFDEWLQNGMPGLIWEAVVDQIVGQT